MSIQGKLDEINNIEIELKRLNAQAKSLRGRRKELQTEIAEYFKKKNLPGVRHQGKVILLEEKKVRKPKTETQRTQDALTVLQKYGIKNAQEVLEEILESRRGVPIKSSNIKFKNPKRNKK